MELNIPTLLLALANLVAGLAIGVYLRKRLVEGNQRNIALQGRQIIENAISEAEQIKKEALLHAKEEALQIKQEGDRELKASRQELKEDQRRLNRKFDEVQREFQILEEKQTSLKYREERLGVSEQGVVEQKQQLEGLIDEQRYKLEQIAGIDREEAKAQLMQSIESEARMDCAKRLARIETEMKLEADRKGKNILALAIARYAGDYVADRTVSMVPLPNDEMKGRIIGREGRNIRAIEAATGIDIIIDDTPEAVILSGFNPIRREVARLALEQLISDGRIHPARIEEVVQKVSEDLEVGIRESGEQATFDVGAHGMHVDLINLVGRLKYRTSYGQNILQHSLEVAFLCGVMAAELGLDVKKAKRAGLLHDIGKVPDDEPELPHAIIGMKLAEKYKEKPEVCNAIGAHHDEIEMSSLIAPIIQVCDAISGARPGARREVVESYIKRLKEMEDIALSYPGVVKTYTIQAGRELRVIVGAEKLSDMESESLSHDIAKKIQDEMTYPGQVKITVIRETRSMAYAK